jgi:hypothetical protein
VQDGPAKLLSEDLTRHKGRRGGRSDPERTWRVGRPFVSGGLKRSHTDETASFTHPEVLLVVNWTVRAFAGQDSEHGG